MGVPANDLDMAGPFVTVMLADPGGIRIRTFDVADPNNVMDAGGLLVDPTLFAGPSCATWGDAVGDLDGIYFLGVDGTQGATGQGFGGIRDPLELSGRRDLHGCRRLRSADHVAVRGPLDRSDDVHRTRLPRSARAGLGSPASNPNLGAHGMHHAHERGVLDRRGDQGRPDPLSVPGVGVDLDLTLTYRSRSDFDYRYGQGWTLNQDVRLRTEPNGDKTYTNGYGRQE